jgi:hypothetical protein
MYEFQFKFDVESALQHDDTQIMELTWVNDPLICG